MNGYISVMQLTVTTALTIVIITDAIAETMVLMIPPMVEKMAPFENSVGEYRSWREDSCKMDSPLLIVIEGCVCDRRGILFGGFGRCLVKTPPHFRLGLYNVHVDGAIVGKVVSLNGVKQLPRELRHSSDVYPPKSRPVGFPASR